MNPESPFVLSLYILMTVFFVKIALKSIFGYIISLLSMVFIPAILLSVIPIFLYFIGFLVYDIPWIKLFLISSSIHFLFFLIVLFFYKKKEHWIKLVISLCIALYAYQSIYVDKYRETWKDKNIVHSSFYSNNYTSDGNETKVIIDIILKKSSLSKYPIPSQNIFSVLKDKYSACDTFDTWQKPDISSLKIHQDEFDTLRKYVMQKPHVDYKYKVEMVDNKAIIIVTSSDRKKMRLLFYLSKSDTWHVDRIITRATYNKKLVHMYGDVSDIQMEETISNPKLLSYYTQEFDSAMKDFILAENAYEVFKARVQYGFALKCMKQYGEWYEYLDYRQKRMHEIVQELNAKESLEENKKRLENIYTGSSFQIMNSIQDEMLANMNIEEDKYISTIELYKIFRKKYLKEMLKDNQFNSDLLEKQFLKYEPLYLPALKRKYMYQRLMQLKEKKIWKEHIVHKIKQLLESNATLNQDVEFRIANKYMKKYPIIAATNVCSYPLIKEILENGTKLDTYTLGESVLFNAITLCDNVDIVRLFISYGANIKESTTLNSFQHLPYITFLVEKVCHDNGQEIIDFLKELYKDGIIGHDRHYNDKIIQNRLSYCNHDGNCGRGMMGFIRGFIYTNKYISKEKLKELFDEDNEMLELIDSLENLKIKDIHYNLKKFEEYEMKHLKVRR